MSGLKVNNILKVIIFVCFLVFRFISLMDGLIFLKMIIFLKNMFDFMVFWYCSRKFIDKVGCNYFLIEGLGLGWL